MESTTTHNPDLMINTYRWGLVPVEEVAERIEADEAKAKAKAARTGKSVTIRSNFGRYEIFTPSGNHYEVEKEIDEVGYGCRETGWWVCYEYGNGWKAEMEAIHPTLRDAKAYLISLG